MRKVLKIFSLICFTSIMWQCLPKTKDLVKTLWKEDSAYVAIIEFANDPLVPYQHPSELDKELIKKALEQLRYQEISFFRWGKPKAIFESNETEFFGEQLYQALKEVNSKQVVEFCLSVKRKELLLPKTFITCGVAFLRDDKLQFVFSALLVEAEKWREERNKEDPRKIFSLELKRIFANESVSHPTVDPQNRIFKKAHSNWAIINLEYTRAILEEQKLEASIEERLRRLKELLDAGLITQEEYDEKKKEILKEL